MLFSRPAAARPGSAFLLQSRDHIEFLPPVEAPDKLLFQVFCNGLPIASARLRRLRATQRASHRALPPAVASLPGTWTLQNIQVAQNYRNRGIGSALLGEIRHHCSYYCISRVVGAMSGDLSALRRWYLRNGFQVLPDNRLELLLR